MLTKIILATSLLLGGAAQAEVVATAPNNAGGEIRLTIDSCSARPGMLFMFSTSSEGNYTAGCWQVADGDIFVIYNNGGRRLYDIGRFTMREKTEPTRRTHKKGGVL